MERLTVFCEKGTGLGSKYGFVTKDDDLRNLSIAKVADTLGAYEDTGLTPEQIENQRNNLAAALKNIEEYKEILEKLKNEQTVLIEEQVKSIKLIEECTEEYRKQVEELMEFKQAEEQGLLLRLPCKVGDTVYELVKCDDDTHRIFPMTVKDISPHGALRIIKNDTTMVWNMYLESDYTYAYKHFSDIGKNIFLTREAAEKALAEMEGSHE